MLCGIGQDWTGGPNATVYKTSQIDENACWLHLKTSEVVVSHFELTLQTQKRCHDMKDLRVNEESALASSRKRLVDDVKRRASTELVADSVCQDVQDTSVLSMP